MSFHRTRDHRILGRFSAQEGELLSDLATQACELLDERHPLEVDKLLASVGIGGSDGPSEDAALARLLPNAYLDDDAAALEFRHLTERGLAERKIANAQRVIADLRGSPSEIELDPDGVQAWLRTLTDIRLIIAVRLGIETDDHDMAAETERELFMYAVYDWLGGVQGTLVEALDS
jgi:hypothetical protein